MNQEEILARLQSVFDEMRARKVFVPASVQESFAEGSGEEWDSFTHLSLIVAIEKAFGIKFGVGEVESARNVRKLVRMIERHLPQ